MRRRRLFPFTRPMNLRLHAPLFFCALLAPLHAANLAFAAVQRADAARLKAILTPDAPALTKLLTDDLVYGHNDGRVQTKAEFITAVVTHQVTYEAIDYEETKLLEASSGVVTMTGRVHMKVSRADQRQEFTLRFLAVWAEDAGKWRLHAYQSVRLPEPAAAPIAP